MAQNEQPSNQGQEELAMLIHGHTCPLGYRCLASDCVECIQIYMERGGENHGGK
jgi:hypothetical protein